MGHETREIGREATLKDCVEQCHKPRSRAWVMLVQGTTIWCLPDLRHFEINSRTEILEKEQCWRKVVVFSDVKIYFLSTFGILLSPQKQFSSTRHHKQSILDLRTNFLSNIVDLP